MLATTNFLPAVDEAFLSRTDLVLELDLPDEDVLARILRSSLREIADRWPTLEALAADDEVHAKLAGRCVGFDGRRARKVVLAALTQRPDLAVDPSRLTAEDLLAAVEAEAARLGPS